MEIIKIAVIAVGGLAILVMAALVITFINVGE